VTVPTVLLLQTLTGVALLLSVQWLRRRPDRVTRWLALVIALLLVSAAPLNYDPVGRLPRSIRILSVLDTQTTDALVRAFERKTGIRCQVDPFQGGARRSADLLLEGRLQPDLMLGGTSEIHELLAAAEVSLPVVLPTDPGRIQTFDPPSGRLTPIYVGYLALVYRQIPDFSSKAPDWGALIDSRWVDRVSLPSPTSTSGGVVFLASQLLRQPDPERGWQYLRILGDAGVPWEARSVDVIANVAAGKADLGVSWAHDAWRSRETDRLPIRVVIPTRTGYEVGAVSALRWARDLPAVEEFIRFLTSREAQQIQAQVGLRVPLRNDVASPAYLGADAPTPGDPALAFYDRARVLREQEGWIARWSAEIAVSR
jgi:ABC-type Fe3+ transport system substrate-binding protein